MSERSNLPAVLAPPAALAGLLAAFRLEPDDQTVLAPGDPAAAIAAELARHGYLGRWTQLQAGDLRHLRLPSLALREDGCLLLTAGRRGRMRVAGRDGVHELAPAALGPGIYLDGAPALSGGSLWRCLLRALKPHWRAFLPLLWAALLVQGSALLLPRITGLLVDRVFPSGARSLFTVLLLATASVGLFQAWMTWLQRRLELQLESRLAFEIEQGLLGHLLRLPFPWLARRTVGELLQGFFGLRAAKDFLTGQVLAGLVSIGAGAGYLILMARTSPGAALVVFAGTLVYLAATLLLSRLLTGLETRAVAAQVKERSFLLEMLNGVALLKATGSEARQVEKWLRLVRGRRQVELTSQHASLATVGALDLFQGLLTQGVLVWGCLLVLRETRTLGEVLAFSMMATAFRDLLIQAGGLIIQLLKLRPNLVKVQEILETKPEPPAARTGPARPAGAIRIRGLCFRYAEGLPWVMEGLDLDLGAGDKAVLRGPSGRGKSTLLKLAAGLYQPDRGEILLAGLPPREARGSVAYLPQSVLLFNGSLLENLRFYSGGASRTALLEAADDTGLAEFVARLPMGYETLASHGGAGFSGGQRQLIALTGLLASERGILLLDEAMANLDAVSKAKLLRCRALESRTVLLVSHGSGWGEQGGAPRGFREVHFPGREPNGRALHSKGETQGPP